jgi:MerR family transcriptional regulator, light-induced transcriptional regulator
MISGGRRVLNINPFHNKSRKDAERRVVVPFAPRRKARPTDGDLVRVIEGEIIPRLLLTQEARAASAPPLDALERRRDSVDDFARRTVSEDLAPLLSDVLSRLDDGATLDALCLDLFAPAARRLGDWWMDDVIGFTDVTVGLCRLQQLVHELGDRLGDRDAGPDAPAILLAAVPGEQHVFGLVLMGEMFRRDGWRVTSATDASADELLDMIGQERFDVVGLSLTDPRFWDPAVRLAPRLRKASANDEVSLMVGGGIFAREPERIAQIGADLSADCAKDALAAANRLVGLTKSFA